MNKPVLAELDLNIKNEDRGRCVILCNRGSIIYGVWRWEIATSSFPPKISKWDREKLQDSWQGNVNSYKRIGKLETFIRRHKAQVQDLDRL